MAANAMNRYSTRIQSLSQLPSSRDNTYCHKDPKSHFHQPRAQTGRLGTANDWQQRLDLVIHFKFPQRISETSLGADMDVISVIFKQFLLDPTVPQVETMEETNEDGGGNMQI